MTKLKKKKLIINPVALALETKLRLFRKAMCSLTFLRAHLNKIQEHLVLIFRLSMLLDQRLEMLELKKRSALFVIKLKLSIMKYIAMVDLQR